MLRILVNYDIAGYSPTLCCAVLYLFSVASYSMPYTYLLYYTETSVPAWTSNEASSERTAVLKALLWAPFLLGAPVVLGEPLFQLLSSLSQWLRVSQGVGRLYLTAIPDGGAARPKVSERAFCTVHCTEHEHRGILSPSRPPNRGSICSMRPHSCRC